MCLVVTCTALVCLPKPLACPVPPFAEGSLAWVEQAGRTPMPHAVFRAAAIGRMGGNSLSLDLPANASDLVRAAALPA